MRIDSTLEKIAEETVQACSEKDFKVNKQDVYRCLDFLLDCIGLGTSQGIPVDIPYLGKIILKVRVNRDLARGLTEDKSTDEIIDIKRKIIEKGKIKKQKISELRNQKPLTAVEVDEILKQYINRNNKSLRFAFNEETKREFLDKLKVTRIDKQFKV